MRGFSSLGQSVGERHMGVLHAIGAWMQQVTSDQMQTKSHLQVAILGAGYGEGEVIEKALAEPLDVAKARARQRDRRAPCRVYTSLADHGDTSAAYTIDTSVLDKCGYALILRGWDRTIRSNNGAVTHSAAKAVGFSVT